MLFHLPLLIVVLTSLVCCDIIKPRQLAIRFTVERNGTEFYKSEWTSLADHFPLIDLHVGDRCNLELFYGETSSFRAFFRRPFTVSLSLKTGDNEKTISVVRERFFDRLRLRKQHTGRAIHRMASSAQLLGRERIQGLFGHGKQIRKPVIKRGLLISMPFSPKLEVSVAMLAIRVSRTLSWRQHSYLSRPFEIIEGKTTFPDSNSHRNARS